MWNLQSGARRKTYMLSPPNIVRRGKNKKFNRVVSGIATDSLNRVVIVSTLDGAISVSEFSSGRFTRSFYAQFFDFHSAKLEHVLQLSANCVSILLNRNSGLLAATCDDMVVRVVDIETRKVVRELTGFRGRVLDTVS
jgi:U3 small nucleolar RNA-associated protein 21